MKQLYTLPDRPVDFLDLVSDRRAVHEDQIGFTGHPKLDGMGNPVVHGLDLPEPLAIDSVMDGPDMREPPSASNAVAGDGGEPIVGHDDFGISQSLSSQSLGPLL